MRVLIVGGEFGNSGSGIERVILDLYMSIRSYTNIDVAILLHKLDKNFKIISENENSIKILATPIQRYTGLQYLFYFLHSRKFIQKFDLIHFMEPRIFLPSILQKNPKILTIHDIFHLNKIRYKIAYNIIDIIFKFYHVPSNYTKKCIENLLSNYKKIFTVNWGISEKFFISPKKKRNKNKITIGTLCPDKFVLEVLKILSETLQKNKEIEFWIGGREEKIQTCIEKNKNIKLFGFIKERDLPNFYKNIDIFVFHSEREGFGLVPLEAMASSCATIVNPITSIKEASKKYKTFQTVNEYVKEILTLLQSNNLLNKRMHEAYSIAKLFEWKRKVKEFVKMYNEVLNTI